MKVAVIYNKQEIKESDVINVFGMPTKEKYKPKTIEMVASALERGGHNVRTIEGNMHIIDELQNFMPRVVRGERPGMVFNMAYGIQGQSRYTHIPAMLEMLGIPYIGSGPAVHAIALDKVLSKIVFLRHNLPTPQFWVFSNADDDLSKVTFPVIVKPKMEAVSLGLRVVHDTDELRNAVDYITSEFQQQALVEGFIAGREFAVPLLGNGSSLETLPIVEIDLGGDPNAIQSVDDKMKHPRGKICPADISREIEDKLCSLSRAVFKSLNAFDFARIDFRMDDNGDVYILEINSMASLNATGSFVLSADIHGYDYDALVNRILEIAVSRYFGDSALFINNENNGVDKKVEPFHVRIRSHVRSLLPSMVKNIEQMVSINSYVYNIEGVNMLANWISNRFQQLAFQRQIIPQVEVGNILHFTNHFENKNDVLLVCHMDTAYDYQNYLPFREERGKIFGSGVAESKGGIAVILAALQALRKSRALKNLRCAVLMTPDENLGGRYSKKIIAETADNSHHVIGMKYGDINGGLVTSCCGTRKYQIEFTNIQRNRSTNKVELISRVAQKIVAWQKLSSSSTDIILLIDSVNAESNPVRSINHAIVRLTIFYPEKKHGELLDSEIRKIAEKGVNGKLQVVIREREHRPPVVETKLNRHFFNKLKKLSTIMEINVTPLHRQSSSDICHVGESIPALDGFGPVGDNVKSSHEFILRDSLIDRSTLLALLMHDCSRRTIG